MAASLVVALANLLVPRPLTWLGKMQITLTALVGVVLIADLRLAWWFHSMASADPMRQRWQEKLSPIENGIWFGTLGIWFLFTWIHLAVAIRSEHPASR